MKHKLDQLEARASTMSPGVKAQAIGIGRVSGGEQSSKQEQYVEFFDQYNREWPVLSGEIEEIQSTLDFYERVMSELQKEPHGVVLGKLVQYKYWEKYTNEQVYLALKIAERTYYRYREQVVSAFWECLPGEFM